MESPKLNLNYNEAIEASKNNKNDNLDKKSISKEVESRGINETFCTCETQDKILYMKTIIEFNRSFPQIYIDSNFTKLLCPKCNKILDLTNLGKNFTQEEISKMLTKISKKVTKINNQDKNSNVIEQAKNIKTNESNSVLNEENFNQAEQKLITNNNEEDRKEEKFLKEEEFNFNKHNHYKILNSIEERNQFILNLIDFNNKNNSIFISSNFKCLVCPQCLEQINIEELSLNSEEQHLIKSRIPLLNNNNPENLINIHCQRKGVDLNIFIDKLISHNKKNPKICTLFNYEKFECPDCSGLLFKDELLKFLTQEKFAEIIKDLTPFKKSGNLLLTSIIQSPGKKENNILNPPPEEIRQRLTTYKEIKEQNILNKEEVITEELIYILFSCEKSEFEFNECFKAIVENNIKDSSIIKRSYCTKFVCPSGLHEISKTELVYAFGPDKTNDMIKSIINIAGLNIDQENNSNIISSSLYKVYFEKAPLINQLKNENLTGWHCILHPTDKTQLIDKLIYINRSKFKTKNISDIIFLYCPLCNKELITIDLIPYFSNEEINSIKQKIVGNELKKSTLKMSSSSPYSLFKEYSQSNLKKISDDKVLIPCSSSKFNKYELINLFITANIEDTFYIQMVDGKSLKCPVCGISHSIEELANIFSSEDMQILFKKVKLGNNHQKVNTYKQQNIQVKEAQEQASQSLDILSKIAKKTNRFHCSNVERTIPQIIQDISNFIIKKLKNDGFWSYHSLICPYCGQNISYSEANKDISIQDLIAIDKVISDHIRNERARLKAGENNLPVGNSQIKFGIKEEEFLNEDKSYNFHCSTNKLPKNLLIKMIIESVSKDPKIWIDSKKVFCPKCNNLLSLNQLIKNYTDKEFQELDVEINKLAKPL